MNLLFAFAVVSGLFGGGCSGGSCSGGSCASGNCAVSSSTAAASFSFGTSGMSYASGSYQSPTPTLSCSHPISGIPGTYGATILSSEKIVTPVVVQPQVISTVQSQTIPNGYKMVCDEHGCRLVKITQAAAPKRAVAERVPYAEPGPPLERVASRPPVELPPAIETRSATFQFYKE